MTASRLTSPTFWKLFGPVTAAIVFCGCQLFIVVRGVVRERTFGAIEDRLRATALQVDAEFQPGFNSPSAADVIMRLTDVSRLENVRITLFDQSTQLIFDTAASGNSVQHPDPPDHSDRLTEVIAAKTLGTGTTIRHSSELPAAMLYVAVRVDRDGQPVGFVRAGQSLVAAEQAIESASMPIRNAILLSVLAAGGVVLLVSLWFAGRVNEIRRAADFLKSSASQSATVGESNDELTQLSHLLAVVHAAQGVNRVSQRSDRSDDKRLTMVLDSLADGIVSLDGQQRIQFVNRAACDMLELERIAAVGRRCWEVLRQPEIEQALSRAIDTERSEDPQPVHCKLARTGNEVEFIAMPASTDRQRSVVFVLHDVTAVRQLENVRRDFVSNVSHELKTPLSIIKACTESLVDGAISDHAVAVRFLGQIDEQSDRLVHLIHDLLQLGRIESGELNPAIDDVSLDDTVRSVVSGLTPLAAAKQISLTVEPPDRKVHVLAETDSLRTIIGNLLDNAIKYTPASGTVTVRWQTAGSLATLDIIDNGIGIPREHHDRIFERFYRVDRARSREVGGTGLGLSIVKHLAQGLGATISVNSSRGTGSTFTLRLPIASPQRKSKPDRQSVH